MLTAGRFPLLSVIGGFYGQPGRLPYAIARRPDLRKLSLRSAGIVPTMDCPPATALEDRK